jgi:hypothetical protein
MYGEGSPARNSEAYIQVPLKKASTVKATNLSEGYYQIVRTMTTAGDKGN